MLRFRVFRHLMIVGVALGIGAALVHQISEPVTSDPAPSRPSSPIPSAAPRSVSKLDSPSHPTRSVPSSTGTEPRVTAAENYLPEVLALSASLNSPNGSADEDIGTLLNLLEVYRKANNENPIGLNHEIVRQLKGDNLKQFAVLPHDFPGLNSEGEVTDRWGTPYFFHAVSDHWMEIRSAGPDFKLWTRDDISSPTLPVKAPAAAFVRAISE